MRSSSTGGFDADAEAEVDIVFGLIDRKIVVSVNEGCCCKDGHDKSYLSGDRYMFT